MGNKRICLYAGSFDPPTNGHLWVLQRASVLFDRLVVAVGDNPKKRGMQLFSIEERISMLTSISSELKNVEVTEFSAKFQVHFAHSIGASYILRGIRNIFDYVEEHMMRNANGDIRSEIDTVFLIPPRNLVEVSSSFVKGLVGYDDWVETASMYVSTQVLKM